MGGKNTTTQNTVSEPWSAAQPYLKEALSGAQDAYKSGEGFKPYPNSTVVPFSSQTQGALNQIENIAGRGNPLGQAAQTQAQGVLNSGGMTDWQKQALGGTYDVATGNRNVTAINDNLGAYARGDYVNGGSPEFNKALDYQAGQLATDINRSVDMGGRSNSPYHVNSLVEGVGNLRTKATADEIARQQGLQMQAAGMLGQEQGANIVNMVGAGQGINQAGNQATQNVANFSQLAPNIFEQQFMPAERQASVGAQYEDLSTRQMQDQINRWQANQQEPWSQLAAYNALIGGAGQLGGTSTSSAQQPANYMAPFGGALAGAQTGSMIGGSFGGIPGWGIGAGLGALGGSFGI